MRQFRRNRRPYKISNSAVEESRIKKNRTLPPMPRVRGASEMPNKPLTHNLRSLIQSTDEEIDFFLTDIVREASIISKKSSPRPKTPAISPPPETVRPPRREAFESKLLKMISKTPEEPLRTATYFFGKPDKTQSQKQRSERDKLITDIQKQLHTIKKPCIDDVFSMVSKKQNLYKQYKLVGKSRAYPNTDPEAKFSAECISKKTSPVPILAYLEEDRLHLNRYKMQDPLCFGLKSALSSLRYVKTLRLDRCGISDAGGSAILEGLNEESSLTSFSYKGNTIGINVANSVLNLSKVGSLTELNLGGCKGSTGSINELCKNLHSLRQVKYMFLNSLGMSEVAVASLFRLLRRKRLEELDISWNQISHESSKQFFKKLCKNKGLQYLNYSWNTLDSSAYEELVTAISVHPSLMHLNLSYTNISDTEKLGNAIAQSKSLVGLHLTGNPLNQLSINRLKDLIDAKRVVPYVEDSGKYAMNPFVFEKPKHIKKPEESNEIIFSRVLGVPLSEDASNWVLTSHCWICDKWEFCTIKVPKKSLEFVGNHKFTSDFAIRGSFNDFKEISLEENDHDYSGLLLLPPGFHKFWLVGNSKLHVTKSMRFCKWGDLRVNTMNVNPRKNRFSLNWNTTQLEVRRFVKEKSVFSAFVEDSNETRNRMFECDSRYYKIDRMLRNSEDTQEVNRILFKYFGEIKEIFDYTMSTSNYPTITMLDFSRFCEQIQVVDNENVNHATLDRLFISANFDPEHLAENPERELCRYEFFEVLVRLAINKYPGGSPPNVTEQFLKEYVLKYATSSRAIRFRREFLYTLEVNDILEANLSNVQVLFMKYKAHGGRWLSMQGLQSILTNAGFQISDLEFHKCVCFSKMSVIDENHSDGAYKKIVFVEFLEFLGRCAAVLYDDNAPLHVKIERMLVKICERNHLSFRHPKKDDDNEESDAESNENN